MVHQGWSRVVGLVCDVLQLHCALLQEYQDVEDEDTLKAVEAAVRESTSVKRIAIEVLKVKWTNVAIALLKGATENKSLRELTLKTAEDSPLQDVVDEVKEKRRRLVVKLNEER